MGTAPVHPQAVSTLQKGSTVTVTPTPPAAQPLRTRRPRTVSQRDDGSCHRGTGLPHPHRTRTVHHGGRGSCSEQGVTRLWRAIRAPAWLLLTSSPPPQARRPWLRAGRQVVRSDRPGLARFAGAGALDTSWCGPNARAFRGGWAGADRKHLTRGVLGAKTKGARACWGLQGRGRGGSALASGKCSCLWLRACSLARAERSAAGAIRRVQAQERDAERGRWVVSVLATRGIDLFAANAIHGGAKRRHARGRYVRRLCCQVN